MKKTEQEIALFTACLFKPELLATDHRIFSEPWMREGFRALQRKQAGEEYDRQALALLPRKLCGGNIKEGETMTDSLVRIVTERYELWQTRVKEYGMKQQILAQAQREAIAAANRTVQQAMGGQSDDDT